jgi:acylpyruvate hydrolase
MVDFLKNGRKIIAIGRNFADHAKELGSAIPKEPFFFLKPTSSYVSNGGSIELPKGLDIHHEVELGVIVGKDGRDIAPSAAFEHVGGYALAIDVTARCLQNKAKQEGLPWSASKGFDTFCPVRLIFFILLRYY